MTTRVRTLSLVSVASLVAALTLALMASTSASADESPDSPDERRSGWMMPGDADRPMMERGERVGRHGTMDHEQLCQHHGTTRGDEQLRERHREAHGEGGHHGDGPMHGDAVREQMREDCDHRDGPQRSRHRALVGGMSMS